MNYQKIQNRFGNWESVLKSFVESQDFDNLSESLRQEMSEGIIRCPEPRHTFRSFQCCNLDNLKAVIMLQDPYFSKDKSNNIVADGIALSCSITDYPQPSLKNFKNEIQKTVYNGLNLSNTYSNNDLLYLEEQGVLMLNAALTVKLGEAGSHVKLWEKFTSHVVREISSQKEGIFFALLGAHAHKLEKHIDDTKHVIHKASHPASAAYSGGVWDSKDMFNNINKLLIVQEKEPIIW